MEEKQLFPQANDFSKIIKIAKIEHESNLNTKYLMEYLQLDTERQISYYLSACTFLGILNNKRQFTDFGWSLRKLGQQEFINHLSIRIVSKPVFGDVFFYKYFLDIEMSTLDIAQLILMLGDISESVAERRASTVSSWIKWIESHKSE